MLQYYPVAIGASGGGHIGRAGFIVIPFVCVVFVITLAKLFRK